MCRSDDCSLPDGFLPASGEEADAGGEWERMGATSDVYCLWLFLLCILQKNMVRIYSGRNGTFGRERLNFSYEGTDRTLTAPSRSPRSFLPSTWN